MEAAFLNPLWLFYKMHLDEIPDNAEADTYKEKGKEKGNDIS